MYYKYILEIELKSAITTPLYADTIWGHICWGIKFNEGENELLNFLKMYEENPPIVLSHAFPANKLPRPIVRFESYKPDITLKKYKEIKNAKKEIYISKDQLIYNQNIKDNKYQIEKSLKVDRIHNSINRVSGQVINGALFSKSEEWYYHDRFFIYIISIFEKDELIKYFEMGFEFGYGADRSTGKGQIKVKSVEEWQINFKGNRYLALADFIIPKGAELIDLQADIITKYGKLGGDYVFIKNPFKKPIVMYKAGSTFENITKMMYVGSLLSNVHNDPSIKHYAIAPIMSFKTDKLRKREIVDETV